jgi:hypothetical protein
MKFLVIRKLRVGTPLMPTSRDIREYKEGAVNAVKPRDSRLHICGSGWW